MNSDFLCSSVRVSSAPPSFSSWIKLFDCSGFNFYSYIIKSRRNIRQHQVQNNSLHNCHYDRIISYSPERGKGWSKTENLEVTQGGSQIAPTVALNITSGYGWLKGETFHQDLGKLLKEPDYWWVLVPNLSFIDIDIIIVIIIMTIMNAEKSSGKI